MGTQFTIRLPEDLLERLDGAADEAGLSRAAYVRKAIEMLLDGAWASHEHRPYEQVRDLAGIVCEGPPDLAADHRRYLLERIRDRR